MPHAPHCQTAAEAHAEDCCPDKNPSLSRGVSGEGPARQRQGEGLRPLRPPPRAAQAAVHAYVSGLRKALEPEELSARIDRLEQNSRAR